MFSAKSIPAAPAVSKMLLEALADRGVIDEDAVILGASSSTVEEGAGMLMQFSMNLPQIDLLLTYGHTYESCGFQDMVPFEVRKIVMPGKAKTTYVIALPSCLSSQWQDSRTVNDAVECIQNRETRSLGRAVFVGPTMLWN